MNIDTELRRIGLLRKAVHYAGHDSPRRSPRWAHVMNVFKLGSTSAVDLCRRFGANPDELRGGIDCTEGCECACHED